MVKSVKCWIINMLLGFDQLGNAVVGGHPDETISSRLGRLKLRNGGKIPWKFPVAKLLDCALECIEKNHSIDAIEPWALKKEGDYHNAKKIQNEKR